MRRAAAASRIVAAVLCTSAVLPAWADKRAEPPLAVYCAGVGDHGFQNADVADSVRDLRNALAGKKRTLRLVDDPAAAHVIVVVEGRERGVRSGEWPLATTSKHVYVTLKADEYELDVSGYDEMFWSLAADQAATAIDRFLKTNRGRLLSVGTAATWRDSAVEDDAGAGAPDAPLPGPQPISRP